MAERRRGRPAKYLSAEALNQLREVAAMCGLSEIEAAEWMVQRMADIAYVARGSLPVDYRSKAAETYAKVDKELRKIGGTYIEERQEVQERSATG